MEVLGTAHKIMDQLEDDTLICVLRLLAACDIGALARTQHAMADAVRRISQNSPLSGCPYSERIRGQTGSLMLSSIHFCGHCSLGMETQVLTGPSR